MTSTQTGHAAAIAPIGHNNGPVFDTALLDGLTRQASEIADAASAWAGTTIENQIQAGELKDFLDAVRDKVNEVEDHRKSEKQPFLDAGRQVDAAYARVRDIIEAAAKLAKAPLEVFLKEQQRLADERRRTELEAARRASEEAERERQIAERNRNAAALIEAEAKAEAARQAHKAAETSTRIQIDSATGSGKARTSLRTQRRAKITNINQAMLHYRDHPDLVDCIIRLANADIRASRGATLTIPGINIIEEHKL